MLFAIVGMHMLFAIHTSYRWYEYIFLGSTTLIDRKRISANPSSNPNSNPTFNLNPKKHNNVFGLTK